MHESKDTNNLQTTELTHYETRSLPTAGGDQVHAHAASHDTALESLASARASEEVIG